MTIEQLKLYGLVRAKIEKVTRFTGITVAIVETDDVFCMFTDENAGLIKIEG